MFYKPDKMFFPGTCLGCSSQVHAINTTLSLVHSQATERYFTARRIACCPKMSFLDTGAQCAPAAAPYPTARK